MQGSDREEPLKQRHNARKIHGVLRAEKIDLPETGGHSHRRGAGATGTLSHAGSFTIRIRNLRYVSTR